MKANKSVRSHSVVEVDWELIPEVVYEANVEVIGQLWGGGRGSYQYSEKFTTEQRPFTLPADDMEDIANRMEMKAGDFMTRRFVEMSVSWYHNKASYSVTFRYDDPDLPEVIKDYFFTGSEDELYDYYPDSEDWF